MKTWLPSVVQFPVEPAGPSGRAFRQDLRRIVAGMVRPAVVFNLPEQLQLNTTVLEFLILCAREAAEHDAEVALATSSSYHHVLLDLTRLSTVLPAFRSLEEAVGHLEKSSKHGTAITNPDWSPAISVNNRNVAPEEDSQP